MQRCESVNIGQRGSRKRAAARLVRCALVATLGALAPSAHAHLHMVSWEVFPDASPIAPGTTISNQFIFWGGMYSGDPLTIRAHTQDSVFISPVNTAVLRNPIDPYLPATARINFVMHGTTIPSVADFLAITAIDAASPNTVFTLSAFDGEDGLIASFSTIVENTHQYLASEDQELAIFSPNIAYFEFRATAPAGQLVEVEFDDLRYNHVLPTPGGAGLLLCAAAIGSRRARR